MNNRLEIQIGNKKLVAEIYECDDCTNNEIVVFIADADGVISQDICAIREHCTYNQKTKEWEHNSEFVDCTVYSDPYDEDYTHKFCIGVYEDEDD